MLSLIQEIERLQTEKRYGRVAGVQGLLVEIAGAQQYLSIGSRVHVETRHGRYVSCEVVGFRAEMALAMPYQNLEGVGVGCKAFMTQSEPVIYPSEAWLGRVVNAFGEPVDGKGPIENGHVSCALRASHPPAHGRQRVGSKIDLGVRALNAFSSVCIGQHGQQY